MCHIVNEIVLDLCITLLSKDNDDGKYECNEQHNSEDNGRNHKSDTRIDV